MVTRKKDADLVFDQVAPSVHQSMMPLPPIKAANRDAAAIEAAKQSRSFSFQHAISSFSPEIDFDSARYGFVIALDCLDTWKIGYSINERHSYRKVVWSLALVANSRREREACGLSCGSCHGFLPMHKGYASPKYLPIYFDVKYFYIEIKS